MIAAVMPSNAVVVWLSLLLCLSLLHFLWQAVAIVLAAVLAGLAARRCSAAAEYVALVAGLVLLPVAFIATLAWQRAKMLPVAESAPIVAPAEILPATIAGSPAPQWRRQFNRSAAVAEQEHRPTADRSHAVPPPAAPRWDWRPIAPWLGAVYLLGVAAMCVRLLIGLGGVRRMAREAVRVEDRGVLDSLARLCGRVGLRVAPQLAYCGGVAVPTLVGICWPTILLPLSAIAGLTPAELESILLHELVHIRRYDHLLNLAQRLVEAAFFFHPAVWFLSRRISVVREHCCDDAVLALGAARGVYIDSLLRVAELGIAAGGLAGRGEIASLRVTDKQSRLRRRITRLLDHPGRSALRLKPAALVCIGLLIIGALATPLLLTALASSRHPVGDSIAVATESPPLTPGGSGAGGDGAAAVSHRGFQWCLDRDRIHGLRSARDLRTGSLKYKGTVVDSATGKPIQGATVRIVYSSKLSVAELQAVLEAPHRDNKPGPGLEATYKTDASGDYVFTLLPDRPNAPWPNIGAVISCPRFAPRYWPVHSSQNALSAESHSDFFPRAKLTPAEKITGMVVDPNGKPVAGLRLAPTVNAWNRVVFADDAAPGDSVAVTDREGRFRATVPQGADVEFVAGTPNPEWIELRQKVGLRRGEIGTMRFKTGERLSVRIVDSRGRPAPGGTVNVQPEHQPGLSGKADEQGRYLSPAVPPGRCSILAFDEGGTLNKAFEMTTIQVFAGHRCEPIELHEVPHVSIRGRLVDGADNPLDSPVLWEPDDSFDGVAIFRSAKHGSIGLTVPADLREFHCFFWNDSNEYNYRFRHASGGPWLQWPEGLRGTSGDSDLIIQRYRTPLLIVTAIDLNGRPIGHITPHIRPPSFYAGFKSHGNRTVPMTPEEQSRSDGFYTPAGSTDRWFQSGIFPGAKFTVRVEARGFESASRSLVLAAGEIREITIQLAAEAKKSANVGARAAAQQASTTQDGTSGSGTPISPVIPRPLEKPLQFSGLVVDDTTQQPVVGAAVHIDRLEESTEIPDGLETNVGSDDILTDAGGRFSFAVRPELAFDSKFWLEMSVSHAHYVRTETFKQFSTMLALMKNGRRPWFEKIALVPGEEVSGTIEDPRGKPLANCGISFRSVRGIGRVISPTDAPNAAAESGPVEIASGDSLRTDEHGRFRFVAVKGAEMTAFWAQPQDFAVICHDVGMKRGDLGAFRVQPGTRLAGTVLDDRGGSPIGGIALTLESERRDGLLGAVVTERSATTDPFGHFKFDPVEDGMYQVSVHDERFMAVRVEVSAKKPPSPIELWPSAIVAIRIRFLDRSGKISNVPHAVAINGWQGKKPCAANLRWTPGKAEGTLPMRLDRAELYGITNPDYLVIWRSNDQSDWHQANDAGPISVELNGFTDLTVVETKLPRLIVRANGPDGKPITQFVPRIRYSQSPLGKAGPRAATVQSDVLLTESAPGQWSSVRLLPDREFVLTVDDADYESASQALKLAEGENREVTVRLAAKPKTGANGQSPPSGVSGSVTDQLGKRVRRIRVSLESESRNGVPARSTTKRTTVADDQGRFAFAAVDNGAYRVTVDDRRYIPIHVDVSSRNPVGAIDFFIPVEIPIELR